MQIQDCVFFEQKQTYRSLSKPSENLTTSESKHSSKGEFGDALSTVSTAFYLTPLWAIMCQIVASSSSFSSKYQLDMKPKTDVSDLKVNVQR